MQQVNLIAYQPQQERAYRRLVPRAVRSIEHPNNANLKVKALGVGERERTSHDIHVGAGRGRPSLRREFVDVLRQLGRPTFVAAWRSYGAALLEQTRLPSRGPCIPSLSSSALRVLGVGVRPKGACR